MTIHIYIRAYIHTYAHIYINIYIHTCIHTYITNRQTDTHTHTHIYYCSLFANSPKHPFCIQPKTRRFVFRFWWNTFEIWNVTFELNWPHFVAPQRCSNNWTVNLLLALFGKRFPSAGLFLTHCMLWWQSDVFCCLPYSRVMALWHYGTPYVACSVPRACQAAVW